MTYRLVIPGKPTPLPRGRPVARGSTGRGRMVYPAAYTAWHIGARVLARRAAREHDLIPGPCLMHIEAIYQRPRNRPESVLLIDWQAGQRIRRPSVPDLDNVRKACQDLLNGIVYHDDAQVCSQSGAAWYGAPGEPPRTVIVVVPVHPVTPITLTLPGVGLLEL